MSGRAAWLEELLMDASCCGSLHRPASEAARRAAKPPARHMPCARQSRASGGSFCSSSSASALGVRKSGSCARSSWSCRRNRSGESPIASERFTASLRAINVLASTWTKYGASISSKEPLSSNEDGGGPSARQRLARSVMQSASAARNTSATSRLGMPFGIRPVLAHSTTRAKERTVKGDGQVTTCLSSLVPA